MRLVVTTDKGGYLRAALVRDGDPDSMAERGVPFAPPDLNEVDWEGVKRDLHNTLVEQHLFTWADVQRAQSGVASAVRACLHRRVIELYKQKAQAVKTAAQESEA